MCHQVIQEVVRKKLKPSYKKCQPVVEYFSENLFIKIADGEHGVFKKQYIPFSESILKHIKEKNTHLGILCFRLGQTIAANGDYHKSIALYEKVRKTYETLLPENSYEISNLYNDWGIAYRHLHKYEESINYLLKSIEIKEMLIAQADASEISQLGISYQNLGVAYRYLGKYDLSIDSFQKAADILQNQEEPYLLGLAALYMNMGSAYRLTKDYVKSLEYHSLSIKLYEENVGLEHPDLATVYNNIAYTYSAKNEAHKSLEYTLKAVKINEQHLEPTHPYLIISYSNLALDFFEIGNFKEAKFYMDNVVAVRKKTLQEDDSDLIKVIEWQKRINTALIG